MQRIKSIARNFIRDDDGATMVEYGLMLALIALVCILIITALGSGVRNKYDNPTLKGALPS